MTEWEEVALGELGRVVTGRTPPATSPEAWGDDFPFVTPTDMDERRYIDRTERSLSESGAMVMPRQRIPTGAIMVSCIGWQLGKVAIAARESFTNQQLNTIAPKRAVVDPMFLYYHLTTRREEIKQLASGGTRTPILNKSRFAALRVRLPPKDIQDKIAVALGCMDDLIENNRRRFAVLEEMAQAIYREWFVHFRYPGHESAILVESRLGPIPFGWTVTMLSQVLELRYGKALKKENRRGGVVAVVSSAGIVGWHDEQVTDGPAIVVGRKGNVGSVTWVDGPSWPIDTAYYVETDLPKRYVVEQLRRTEFLNTHAAVPGLSREQAYSRPFLQPPGDLMEHFSDLSQVLASQASAIAAQADRLASMRDLLLPKLVTGQIDVSSLDLDALVEGSVA